MHLSLDNDVAILRMEAGKANAFSPEMLVALARLFDDFEKSPARAAVLTGYEGFFSAGLALPSLVDLDRATMGKFIRTFESTMQRVWSFPRPVVAAVNGHAIAGGCVLALQCDVRIMAAGKAKIGLNEVALGIGLPPVVLETLRSQVPATSLFPIAAEAKLSSPEEALALGLVHEVVGLESLEARAIARATELAALPPLAFAQVKSALRRPAVEEAARHREPETERWLDTWFSADAQKRLRDAVARIKK